MIFGIPEKILLSNLTLYDSQFGGWRRHSHAKIAIFRNM